MRLRADGAEYADPPVSDSQGLRWAAVIVAFVLGAMLAASLTLVLTRGTSLPRATTVTGTVEGLSSNGAAFGFRPDGGIPTSYELFETRGLEWLRAGQHVRLQVVEVEGRRIVIAITRAMPS